MKKLLILAGVIVLTTSTQAFAKKTEATPQCACQRPRCERPVTPDVKCPGKMHRPPHFDMKRFEDELNLTDAQKEQAKQLREQEFEAIKPLKEQMGEIHKQYKQKFEAILTEDQLKKLETIKAERKQRFEARKQRFEACEQNKPMNPNCECGCNKK